MSNEARITASLQIIKGATLYTSRPTAFTTDVNSEPCFGPTPGAFEVPVQGVACDLGALITPGLCRIQNLADPIATPWPAQVVQYGINDPVHGRFYPIHDLWPGESYVVRLSADILQEYGTGTGTAYEPGSTQFWFRSADPAGDPVPVNVEAFDL